MNNIFLTPSFFDCGSRRYTEDECETFTKTIAKNLKNDNIFFSCDDRDLSDFNIESETWCGLTIDTIADAWTTPDTTELTGGGIYALENSITKKIFYVGATNDFKTRKYQHFLHDGINHSHSKKIDAIFSMLTPKNITFLVLESCEDFSDTNLHQKEQFWITKLSPSENSTRPSGLQTYRHKESGWKHSTETKNRMSQTRKALKLSPSDTTKNLMSKSHGGSVIQQIDIETGAVLAEYISYRKAAADIGKPGCHVKIFDAITKKSKVHNLRKSAFGFYWQLKP